MKLNPIGNKVSGGLRINPISSNMTEVEIGSKCILFSYRTPVAYKILGLSTYYKTNKKWSNTTTRHITKWINKAQYNAPVVTINQEELDNLIK